MLVSLSSKSSPTVSLVQHLLVSRMMPLREKWLCINGSPPCNPPSASTPTKKNFPPRLGSGSSFCPRASFIPTRLCLGLVTVTYRVTMRSNLVSCCFYSLIVNSSLYSLLRFFRSFIRFFLDCFVYWNRNIIACSRRCSKNGDKRCIRRIACCASCMVWSVFTGIVLFL